ncbi:MAG: dihydroorotate dehydrogenase [Candidatus Bathyarchaeota archaeon]
MSLKIEIVGLKMANPVMNASGILGKTASSLLRLAESGVGAVVTKSIGKDPRRGYENPTIVEVKGGLINAMGLPNPGVKEYVKELGVATKNLNIPTIASIYGFSPEEYEYVAKKMEKTGVSAIELNVSCPHVKEVGIEIGQSKDDLSKVVKKVKSAVKIPMIVKLNPNVSNIVSMARIVEKAGADAVVTINSLRAMAIDVETGKPILGGKFGGLSGSAIKPIAVRCVYEIFEAVDIPIIGCGGINSWEDAVEFFLAGASAVQVGTALMHRDLKVFREITDGLEKYLRKKKFQNVGEIVGLSHE